MKNKKLLTALLVMTSMAVASCTQPSSSSSSSGSTSTSTTTSQATSSSSSSSVVAKPTFSVPTYLENEDVSTWEDGSIKVNKVSAGELITVYASDSKGWTVEGNKKTADDGKSFTKRLKSGGKTTKDGRYIKVDTTGASKLALYAISGSSSETRNITVVQDWTEVGSELPAEGIVSTIPVVGDKLCRYEVELKEGATYTLHLAGSINFYGFELIDTVAGDKVVEIENLKIVGPTEYKVGGEFKAEDYQVYGVGEKGTLQALLESGDYVLGTIDTSAEKIGDNALKLTVKHAKDDTIVGELVVEVYKWFNISIAETLENGTISTAEDSFKNGSDVVFSATPAAGYELKSVVVKVNNEPVSVTVENNGFKVEGANGDIKVESAVFSEVVVTETLEEATLTCVSLTSTPDTGIELTEATAWGEVLTLRGDLSGKAWKVNSNSKKVLDSNGEVLSSTHRVQSNGANIMDIDLSSYEGKVTIEFYVLTGSNSDLTRTITIKDATETEVSTFTCNLTSDDAKNNTDGTNTQKYSVTLDCGQKYTLHTSNGINFHGANIIPVVEG